MGSGLVPLSRAAAAADIAAVVESISTAFIDDPLWSWVFPDGHRRLAQYRTWWRLFVEGGLRYPWLRVTNACEAVAVWIPPGGTELALENEAQVEEVLAELVGSRLREVLDLLELFETSHPRHPEHYYLSLFGTHVDHRGRGLGMALLAENLELIDDQRMPAYLESSNPANLGRYQSVGFVPTGNFSPAAGGPVVTTMWRPAR